MIYLFTGLPGAGKTLYAMNYVQNFNKTDKREVYYHGIEDLKLDWKEIDKGETWPDLPKNSIIVLDEAQQTFRPRTSSSKVPEHVGMLEVHRHEGKDLFLITQHPQLIDVNVRKLVGKHFHVVRAFGYAKATVHEFQHCVTDPVTKKRESIKHLFSYPKESFNWYKSAETHTHQAKLPAKVYFLFIAPILLGLLIYYLYASFTDKTKEHINEFNDDESTIFQSDLNPTKPKTKQYQSYLSTYKPVVKDLPYTAARYLELTQPTKAPYPAACVRFKNKCTCWTQQATKLKTSDSMCNQIVDNGLFLDFDNNPTPKQPLDLQAKL